MINFNNMSYEELVLRKLQIEKVIDYVSKEQVAYLVGSLRTDLAYYQKLFYNNYHFQIIHNDPRTQKYKDEFFKRYLIWKDAISTPRDNVFYLLYSNNKYILDFPDHVKKKTINIGIQSSIAKYYIPYSWDLNYKLTEQEKKNYFSEKMTDIFKQIKN